MNFREWNGKFFNSSRKLIFADDWVDVGKAKIM